MSLAFLCAENHSTRELISSSVNDGNKLRFIAEDISFAVRAIRRSMSFGVTKKFS